MTTTLQRTMPHYDFAEQHNRRIAADAQVVWQALTSITVDQLPITKLLVAVRHLGSSRAQRRRPLLTDGPVHLLEVSAPWYAVGGNIARPWQWRPQTRPVDSLAQFVAFDEPGWVKYLVDFRVQPAQNGVILSTVTRVACTDRRARRRFTPYWALIRVGSGLIRRDLLAAVDRAATRSAGPGQAADSSTM